jgi:hypothetical protein
MLDDFGGQVASESASGNSSIRNVTWKLAMAEVSDRNGLSVRAERRVATGMQSV